jgi:hypothetical protein
MHLSTLPLLSLIRLATSLDPQYIFSNPPSHLLSSFKIPTVHESAILARRIFHLTPLGTLSTVFPKSSPNTLEDRPASVAGLPHGLMDYIADCEPSGDPTLLAINVETSFKNAAAGSNVSISVDWTPPYPPKSRIGFFHSLFSSPDPVPYSAANLPRFALLGYLELISQAEVEAKALDTCFVATHQDAKLWLPGNRIHEAHFMRLIVKEVYWIGGFGDRAYIGWIPADVWKNVTREEWASVRLPGEKKGWKEWSATQWEL